MREPRDNAAADEQPAEIAEDLRRRILQRGGAVRFPDAAHRAGQRGKRLVGERHGPRTAQAVAHLGNDGLERVVPVAVAVGCEVRSGNHSAFHQVQSARDVRGHRGVFADVRALVMEKRDALIQHRRIACGEEVFGEGEHRPIDDVAVRISWTDAALALEKHEPLRPVAVRVLLAENAQQDIAHRPEAPEPEHQLDRALAHVARAPAAAGKLLQPARREVVDQRVLHEPRKNLRRALGRARVRRRDRQPTGDGIPKAGVAGAGGLDEMAFDGEVQGRRCGGDEAQEMPSARDTVREKQLVAPNRFDDRSLAGNQPEAPSGKAPPDVRVWRGAHADAAGLHVHGRWRGVGILAVDREAVRDEHPGGRPVEHAHGEAQFVAVGGSRGDNFDGPALVAVDPAARAERHLEGGRRVEQLPAPGEFNENALAVAAEKSEVAVTGAEEAVDAHVALRDHRVEHAAHPRRGRQRRLVGHKRCARAQQVPVGPQRRKLFLPQDHMAAAAGEKRKHPPLLGLGVAVLAAEMAGDFRVVQIERLEHGSQREKRRRAALSWSDSTRNRRHGLGQRERRVGLGEIGVRRGGRVIRLEPCEKPARSFLARRERERRVLHRGHRVLALQARARQPLRQRRRALARARGEAEKLERVRRERNAPAERPDEKPREASAHGLVLPRGHHAPALGVIQRGVVHVLADVKLVEPHGAFVGERDVLRVDEVARRGRGAGIFDLDVPEPRERGVGENQPHPEREPRPFSAGREAAAVGAGCRGIFRAD